MRLRLIVLLALAGCPREEVAPPSAPEPAEVEPAAFEPAAIEPAAPAPAAPEAPTLRAGEAVAIPAGVVLAGSRPGASGREPRDEADLVPVAVPAFSIDRLPFPNDPDQPPRTGVTQPEAAALCAEAGKRLCHELEWERACEGPDAARSFPTGDALDLAACAADPLACVTPEGVARLGTALGEWTASPGSRGLGADLYVFRGSSSDELATHRCAARRGARSSTRGPSLGFRCCEGPAPELEYPTEARVARFTSVEADRERLRAVLAGMPEVARFASAFEPFDPEVMLRALPEGLTSLRGWELPTTPVLRWSPRAGEVVWVFAGRAGSDALLVVAHPLPDGRFVHGASYVITGEPGPIAFAFTPPSDELLWSNAWGAAGQGGAIVVAEDSRITIVQR